MSKKLEKISKFLSLILRHKPEEIGLILDKNGWADISQLIELSTAKGVVISEQTIFEVVATSDKQRFSISDDGLCIRANQGHSIAVDLELKPLQPPEVLFHGTATRFWASIASVGLSKMNRQHVHLTESVDSALSVGARYGKPVLLRIDAHKMSNEGHLFYRSENGVWL